MHSVRMLMNAGHLAYCVTAVHPLVFLYEEPDKYDHSNILQGLMRGYFLIWVSSHCMQGDSDIYWCPCQCFQALFISPAAGINPLTGPTPIRVGLLKRYELSKVTIPVIIYTAIQVSRSSMKDGLIRGWHGQARFALGSQDVWSGRDAMFDYGEFAGVLFEIFKLDKTWTNETIAWWNM